MMSLEDLDRVQLLVDDLQRDGKQRIAKQIHGKLWSGSRGDKIRRGKEFYKAVENGEVIGLQSFKYGNSAKYERR